MLNVSGSEMSQQRVLIQKWNTSNISGQLQSGWIIVTEFDMKMKMIGSWCSDHERS
jgi:hypothetical protein